MKKILTMLLAVAMILTLSSTALAEDAHLTIAQIARLTGIPSATVGRIVKMR